MISSLTKSEPKASSLLGLSVKSEEPTLSFSELLKGAGSSKDGKTIQNGALVLSLKDQDVTPRTSIKSNVQVAQKESFSSLLKGEDKSASVVIKEPLELNPKLTQNLSIAELKIVMKDAKEYLKEKIEQSDGYKKAQIKELPTTLKGLVEVAKKFDIDISKITLEQVQTKSSKTQALKEATDSSDVAKESKLSSLLSKDSVKDEKISSLVTKESIKDEKIPSLASKENAKDEKVSSALSKDAPKLETRLEQVFRDMPQDKESSKTQSSKGQTQLNKTDLPKQTQVVQAETQNLEVSKTQDKKTQELTPISQLKETPLFKAQERTEQTTEQFVQTKQFKVDEKTPKQKADETLKLLLRGEKPTQNATAVPTDFSVATAKALAGVAPTEGAKSLETLLRGEISESTNTNTSKLDGLLVNKADSFEVKINEAKQMIKYLSQDVKSAIEDYKSPFTRVKVQLNPQRLGEVDLTIVQRGKNLHVNISSNNAAINTLVMNANELRTQLSNNGINNASLNFSNNSQSDNSGAFSGQSQNREQQQKAQHEYNYFADEGANEEVLSSLEIVVANYA
ncbi:MAG: flagellar hook-length control protein FliK [Sulfurimonas sp.]|nr:flagellar hook-length control protein FliK [Sulfurimonas sp.]